MLASTIAAISTPPGSGGIGIIKISGPKSIEIAQSVFVPGPLAVADQHNFDKSSGSSAFVSRRLYYGHIINPATRHVTDEVLFAVMRAPYSYTAEDVVEIQAHAGPLVLKSILALLIEQGVRLAEPGEFTKRAFLNGRIDLTQAEAVMDILNARSQKAIDMAMAQLSGGFRPVIESLHTALLGILSVIEAEIDFPEETSGRIDINEIITSLESHIIPICLNLISQYEAENFLREGLKVVIVGAPNVGKSSLLNCLVNRERAIVSEFAGTTRDFIEDSFITKGIPVIVTDTAGIHEHPNPVERVGIEKAWEHIHRADIILFTVDVAKPVSPDDLRVFNQISGKQVIVVINKIDLPREQYLFSLPLEWQNTHRMEISALCNQGITELKELIARLSVDSIADSQPQRIVPNLRHKTALEKGLALITEALSGLRRELSFELVAIDLKNALNVLDEIMGENIKADVLEQIFDRFCVGK